MRFKEWDDYLDSMLSHVKFTPDRKRIRQEFEEHIEDMFEEYMSEGMSENEAEEAVLDNIGDSAEIGKLLNKAHNALIGWLWQALKMCLVILLVLCLNPVTGPVFAVLARTAVCIPDILTGYDDVSSHGETVWTVDIDEKVVMDDHKLKFDQLVLKEDGTFELRYRDITSPLKNSGEFDLRPEMIFNEEGITCEELGGSSNGGYVDDVQLEIVGLPDDSKMIVIEYNGDEALYRGRHFRIEVELVQ